MKNNRKGIWLIEILVVIIVLFILASISLKLIGFITQKARVVSAKAQISQLALALESVKDNTGYYPVFLNDLTVVQPPKLHENGWAGPYVSEVPLDPWGSIYFYEIPPTTLWTSPALPRTHGAPEIYTYDFETNAGKAIFRVENYGVTSCSITLNGVELVDESEFKKNPCPQIIEKEITLQEGNNVFVWARSKPDEFLHIIISSSLVPSSEYFILGSYGLNNESGGKGFDSDIVWDSRTYPNFQPQQ